MVIQNTVFMRWSVFADRLRSFELRVGDVEPVDSSAIARNALCRNVWSPVPPGLQEFRCNSPLQGRYLILRGLGTAPDVTLSVCEVVPVYTPIGNTSLQLFAKHL